MKKGQGAMEYLMTYGWAILVVLIVGIVLWKTGLFGTSATGTSGFDVLVPDQWKITNGANTSIIKFHNVAGRTLSGLSFSVSEDGTAVAAANIVPSTTKVGPGGTVNLNYTTGACTTSTGSTKVDVTITYSINGIQHQDTGTIYADCE